MSNSMKPDEAAPAEADLLSRLQQDTDGAVATQLVRDFSVKARQQLSEQEASAGALRERMLAYQTGAEIIERVAAQLRRPR